MTHATLFSGIGGPELAASIMGWTNVFHCEINPFGRVVLDYHWPESVTYEDITTTDFRPWRGSVSVLTGGFPCQPFSAAGKRLGTADSRHLWPQMHRAIREIKPRWVVGENVFGLLDWSDGLVLDQIIADLGTEGYQTQAFVLPASGVNAPHRRYRLFVVGFNPEAQVATNTGLLQWNGQWAENINPGSRGQSFGFIDGNGGKGDAAHPNSTGLQGSEFDGAPYSKVKNEREQSPRSITQLHQIGNWTDFPTQSALCGRNDGLPRQLDGITLSKWRTESLKAYGNAIVPQVILQIYKAIQAYENHINHE
jgi:DNA (cytosine-5)-methyltransferase 1